MKKYICECCKGITTRKEDGSEDIVRCTRKGCYDYIHSADDLIDGIKDLVKATPFDNCLAREVIKICNLLEILIGDEK